MNASTINRIGAYMRCLATSSPREQTGRIWGACAGIADALLADDAAFDRDLFMTACGFGSRHAKGVEHMTTDSGVWIVLEVPHLGDPRAFTCDGESDFLRRHCAERGGTGGAYECTTARRLAEGFGATPDTADDPELDAGWIARLGREHGWDTPLYRADWVNGEGIYSPDPVSEYDAVAAEAAHDLSGWYCVKSEAEARELYGLLTGGNAPRIGKCGPLRAAMALSRQARAVGWVLAQARVRIWRDESGWYWEADESGWCWGVEEIGEQGPYGDRASAEADARTALGSAAVFETEAEG